MRALLHRTPTALFDQMMGRVTADTLVQRNTHSFGQHQALGGFQIDPHALGVYLQTGYHLPCLLQRTGH
ncbi:hypothetical protein ALP90_200022 [Pseudomonas amygdali pv. ulmi]|uniref:Uncharacterized protein n=1 Tax=Pseudomonas amygdali pv. ulmi TaxID=251720 RepID=A0A3M4SNQ4_PSEA0|nr:hypothetical protein ALP90_200022 [Pseudomonas amygdali pv. ulmi]